MLPGVAPLGYLNDTRSDHKCEYLVDPIRAPIVRMIFEKVGKERWSGPKIYYWLKEKNFKTKNNKDVTISSIYELLKNPFYCGVFEYPRGSGNWYVGKHEPLITRELFEAVRQKVTEETKPRKPVREYAFISMMTCGYCDSGVTAMTAEKLIKSEGVKRTYIYYVCNRSKDRRCKNPYIREDNLMTLLGGIIDEIEIDKLGAKHLIEKEVARFNKLNANVLGGKEKAKFKEMDIKRYAKYLLEEGSIEEKRELLEHLQGKIVMKDKKIILANYVTDIALIT